MTEYDFRAFRCPIPQMKVRQALKGTPPGQSIQVTVKESAIADIRGVVRMGKHIMVSETRKGDEMVFVIQKV